MNEPCTDLFPLPVYYPAKGVHICNVCKNQVVYFDGLGRWAHMPTFEGGRG